MMYQSFKRAPRDRASQGGTTSPKQESKRGWQETMRTMEHGARSNSTPRGGLVHHGKSSLKRERESPPKSCMGLSIYGVYRRFSIIILWWCCWCKKNNELLLTKICDTERIYWIYRGTGYALMGFTPDACQHYHPNTNDILPHKWKKAVINPVFDKKPIFEMTAG